MNRRFRRQCCSTYQCERVETWGIICSAWCVPDYGLTRGLHAAHYPPAYSCHAVLRPAKVLGQEFWDEDTALFPRGYLVEYLQHRVLRPASIMAYGTVPGSSSTRGRAVSSSMGREAIAYRKGNISCSSSSR